MFVVYGYNHSEGKDVKMQNGSIVSWNNYNFVCYDPDAEEGKRWSFVKISNKDLNNLGLSPDQLVKHSIMLYKDYSGYHVAKIDILK